MKSIFLLAFVILSNISFGQNKSTEPPKITKIKFGEIKINGETYEKDVVIENGKIRKRKKGPSKEYKKSIGSNGHTPLTEFEEIPWDCKVLVIGIGMSKRLPVTDAFKAMAKEKGVELIMLRTPEAIDYFMENYTDEMNAIFHITC